MNVVGRFGSLISQGVYSVATPFHPFGGAVDIIIVEQHDGTYKSTPWYVRFGKFQGVLKGTEKIVRIEVNGVEANFNMFLDNSGEAYFVREVDLGKDGCEGFMKELDILEERREDNNDGCSNLDSCSQENVILKQDATDFSNGNVEVRDERVTLGMDRLDRVDSGTERIFYDLQEEKSSLEGSLEFSEYGGSSGTYDNVDSVRHELESQDSNSEVVLVSIDGHILTAPLSSSGRKDDVELSAPQFHLSPDEGIGRYKRAEDTLTGDYLNEPEVTNENICNGSSETVSSEHHLEPCAGGDGEHMYHGQNTEVSDDQENVTEVSDDQEKDMQVSDDQEKDMQVSDDQENDTEVSDDQEKDTQVSDDQEKEPCADSSSEVFQSCLELHKLAEQSPIDDQENVDSSVDIPETAEYSNESSHWSTLTNKSEEENHETFRDDDQLSEEHFETLRDNDKLSPHDSGNPCSVSSPLTEIATIETSTSDMDHEDSDDMPIQFVSNSKENSHLSPLTDKTEEENHKTLRDYDILSEENLETLRDNDKLPPHNSGNPVSVSSPQAEFATDERNTSDMDHEDSDHVPAQFVSNDEELLQQVEGESTAKAIHSSGEAPVPEVNSETEHSEPENSASVKHLNPEVFARLEISLCGHLLHAGMGLSAAQEAFDANRIRAEEFKLAAKSIVKNDNLIVRIHGQYIPWNKAEHVILGMTARGSEPSIEPNDVIPVEQETHLTKEENQTPSRGWSLWSIPFRRIRTPEKGNKSLSDGDVSINSDTSLNSQPTIITPTARAFTDSPRKQIIRTNVPTTDEIVSLNLKEGQNMVNFVFSTRVLGSQKIEAHIYLWKWNTRIVISDVDGTITKSDVLGQFMPLVGKDWTHSGIARLFSAIKENGYQLLFLSARAIVQAYLTKSFLFNLKQDGKSLPVGPVVISPDGLFPSLYREVIRRAPHEFKIACLEDIKALFPPDHNPFYAGFGNRETDELSYRKIGIPKGKIFIINPKGEVAVNHQIDVKSYTSLHTLVNDMFPPTPLLEQEDFNSWNYWKMPLPDIDNL